METCACFLNEGTGFVHGRAANRGDGCTRLGKRDRDALANAGIGAGNDGNFAGKIKKLCHRCHRSAPMGI